MGNMIRVILAIATISLGIYGGIKYFGYESEIKALSNGLAEEVADDNSAQLTEEPLIQIADLMKKGDMISDELVTIAKIWALDNPVATDVCESLNNSFEEKNDCEYYQYLYIPQENFTYDLKGAFSFPAGSFTLGQTEIDVLWQFMDSDGEDGELLYYATAKYDTVTGLFKDNKVFITEQGENLAGNFLSSSMEDVSTQEGE